MSALIEFDRPTEVVDIGANPIDGDPPYKAMLANGGCRVTGFEPQPEELEKLRVQAGPNERYFPDVVGDGKKHTLRVCRWSGMSSLFEPDHAHLALFDGLRSNAVVIERRPGLKTRRLDDMDEIKIIDLLKIDVQGSELMIFQNGREKLRETVVIHTEVAFFTLYEKQPTHGEVDAELRAQGFMPFALTSLKLHYMATGMPDTRSLNLSRQLVDTDIIYVRDYARPADLSDSQLKHLFAIMVGVYNSPDVALRCLQELARRKAVPAWAPEAFAKPPQAGA